MLSELEMGCVAFLSQLLIDASATPMATEGPKIAQARPLAELFLFFFLWGKLRDISQESTRALAHRAG